MKTSFPALVLFLIVSLFSCKKQGTEPSPAPLIPVENLASLKDSASYTIDGKLYTCNKSGAFSRINSGTNRDASTGNFLSDSIQYATNFEVYKWDGDDVSSRGSLSATFIKIYTRDQLQKPYGGMLLLTPKKELDLYTPGNYSYALDYIRFNRQSGIALAVNKWNGSAMERLFSYSDVSYTKPSTIPADIHKNSTFEITRFVSVGEGAYLLEAKFSATMFDRYENPYKVENGFIRLKVFEL